MAGAGGPGGADGGADGGPGGLGAAARGGLGAEPRFDSGSEEYGAWSSAPVLTPPDFLSFGIPPANIPANCGAAAGALPPSLPSLLLLARFAPPGTGGALPGIAGAPIGAAGASLTLPTIGADRSLTCVTFFSRAPLVMSPKSAPCELLARLHVVPVSRVNTTYSASSWCWSFHPSHWRRRRWHASSSLTRHRGWRC
jgi:hypothetical protein